MPKLIILLVTLTLAAFSSWMPPAAAQTQSAIVGTWFGTIVLTSADGKVSHDHAVLVVEKTGTTANGSMGRTIDQLTPWASGSFSHRRLVFHLDAAGGLDITLKMTTHLAGTATGKGIYAQIDLTPAPGLLPHQQLEQEIMMADRQLYQAFGSCDVAGYEAFLSSDLEFYQDHTGKTGYVENLKAVRDRCAEGIRYRRELEPDSLIVNAAPGFGAIQAGTQRFYSQAGDGQDHLEATARFTNVWSKKSGAWKLVRVISYDHR